MRRRTTAAMLAAGLLVLGACGGDDGEEATDAGETSEEAGSEAGGADGTDAAGDGAADPAAEGDGDGAGDAAEGGSGDEGGSENELCAAYESMNSATDAEAVAQQFEEIDPPAEIADAWETVISGGTDPDAAGDPDVMAAYQEVSTYVMETCFPDGNVPVPEGGM